MRVPLTAAIIGLIISILIDLYIYFDIKRYANPKFKKSISVAYAVSSLLLWSMLIIVLLLPKRDASYGIDSAMWMLFTYLSIYIPKVLYLICSAIGRLFTSKNKQRNIGSYVGFVIACVVFITFWVGAIVTRRQIDVVNIEVTSPKIPKSFDGYRVLQFSDAHVGTWGNDTSFVSKLVDRINSEHADLILFTGDIVNRESSEIKPFLKTLSRIKAKDGVMMVFGNHDYSGYVDWPSEEARIADFTKLDSMVRSIGWINLKNGHRFVKAGNDSIAVIGVENWGEPPFNKLGDLISAYPKTSENNLNDNNYKILMTHNPNHWRCVVTDESNIDLTLSGHTHAMQFEVKAGGWRWSPAVFRYPNWAGLYTSKAKDGTPMQLYVNIGCGEVGFPARIGAAVPELTVFTLRSDSK